MPALFIGVNEDDEDELLEFAKDGVIDVVKMLITESTYIDTTDENGWTPLMWAGSTLHTNVIKNPLLI